MVSVVSICNLALSNLGKNNINSLDEASAEARACKQFYEQTRDGLLQAHPWTFAGKTMALSEIANEQPGQWRKAYSRPVGCLKVRYIRPAYSTVSGHRWTMQELVQFPYELEAETIYCNIDTAFLRFTSSIVDPTKFPPLFIDALSWTLSVRLAMPLTRDMKMRADAYKLAQVARGEAETADANEERHSSDIETDFVTERATWPVHHHSNRLLRDG
jgi:hypothetical protein